MFDFVQPLSSADRAFVECPAPLPPINVLVSTSYDERHVNITWDQPLRREHGDTPTAYEVEAKEYAGNTHTMENGGTLNTLEIITGQPYRTFLFRTCPVLDFVELENLVPPTNMLKGLLSQGTTGANLGICDLSWKMQSGRPEFPFVSGFM